MGKQSTQKESVDGGEVMVCTSCGRSFQTPLSYSRHASHCKGKHLTCQKCDAKFDTLDLLREHIIEKHKGTVFPCLFDECPCSFATKKGWEYHVGTHSKRSIACTSCNKSFESKAELAEHNKSESHKDRNSKFQCVSCEAPFLGKAARDKHYSTCPFNNDRQVRCAVCNRGVGKLSEYLKHLKDEHECEHNCLCTRCLITLESKKLLNEHMATCMK